MCAVLQSRTVPAVALSVWCAAVTLGLPSAAHVRAQTTRADEARTARETKARTLQPHRRPRAEAMLFAIEDDLLLERVLNPPRGFHARVGGLGEGAGFGLGPAFRYNTPGYDVRVSAAASPKGYFLAEGAVAFPGTSTDNLYATRATPFVELYARRRDFPQQDFFGIGPASVESARSDYALRDTFVSVTAGWRSERLRAGVSTGYLEPSIGAGTDRSMPSTPDVFPPADVPGLSIQPSFTVIEPFVEWTTVKPAVDDLAGGRYRLTFGRYADRGTDGFSFDRWDVDVRQYIPFTAGTRTIALRARLTAAIADEDQAVPFYLQPTLGGATTLRSFRTFRFQDDSALLLQAEYRWRINEFVSGALFYDAGAVARRLDDLGRLETSYGFGFRGGPRAGVAFRMDVAFGREGARLLVRFEDAF